mgnify:FL=1
MKSEYIGQGVWLSSGEGYDRPILAEGYTKAESYERWIHVYNLQYENAQRLDNLSLNSESLRRSI